jgi:hypothetical protein
MLRPTHPYIRLKAEFVYLAVILDGFSRKVVGWAQWLPRPKILHPYPYLRFDATYLR